MTIAKLPLAKDIDGFAFDSTQINETLVRDLSSGAFLAEQRNAVLIGGSGHGQNASGHRHRESLHPRWRQGPVLQCRRPDQPAG